jgi:3'-5' exoribonuclease
MGRRFISQLADREAVNEVYQVSGKQLRPNRNGNLYLQVSLSDRSGALCARMWNASDQLYHSFQDGDFVRVEGTAQLFQGEMQVIATKLQRVPADGIDVADFTIQTPEQIERLVGRLGEILRGLRDPYLRALAESFLIDEEFLRDFRHVPAGIKNHHAYLGGLLEHVVTIMEVIVRIADLYPMLDRDMLLMGAFLHDAGKIEELSYDKGFSYTDSGQLIGHVVLAIGMIDRKAVEAEQLLGEPIPPDTLLRLKHLVISHHGSHEFGAPRLPMTLEAVALWQLDNLDAKLQSIEQLIRDDPNSDSTWTLYNPSLGRKLYKGKRGER